MTLARAPRVLFATAFCLALGYALLGRAIPWALARLPLAAPLVLVFAVALAATVWATLDAYRA
jgi:hypothetical protein